ncbi:MAG: Pyruvate carboxylase [Frankiales bacterium]|jgi:oxaloacetate decarboxylase alpha subunit|nr:Pyruvate carboxylase [Frankiales bacterium]
MTTVIDFVDQTLRDGQQSLWGIRMRAYQAAQALPSIDRTGFSVVDLTGPGMFTVLLRQFRDDPWVSTDYLVQNLPTSKLRSGMRARNILGFGFTPDSIMDLWVATLIKHGITEFWLYDCLYDLPTMKRLTTVIHEAGGEPVPSIMYGFTSVHDDAFFADRAREMATWPGVRAIYVEDAAGVLTPDRAATLLPALRAATGDVTLELHCHNTTGLAQHNYIEGMKAGFTRLHTASRPMANGPSLPSTEGMLPILERMDFEHRLDTSQLEPVANNFLWAARDAGFSPGQMAEYDPRIYDHQLPGGMTGTLKNQLAQAGMAHRMPDVLAEIPQVRRELGEPIMATPFSQFVGIQSVLNIITGDRYSMVPDEVIQYALGQYGPVPSPIAPDVLDRILAVDRAEHFRTWEQPQPSLAEVRKRFPKGISDEELLLRLMTSDKEVDDLLAAAPFRVDPRRRLTSILSNVEDLVAEKSRASAVRVTTPDYTLRLRKSGG